jgi:hypothetical protein
MCSQGDGEKQGKQQQGQQYRPWPACQRAAIQAGAPAISAK